MIIPNNKDIPNISFTKYTKNEIKLQFIDKFRFLNTNLNPLASYLSLDQFYHIKKYFTNKDLPFVTRKGIRVYRLLELLY